MRARAHAWARATTHPKVFFPPVRGEPIVVSSELDEVLHHIGLGQVRVLATDLLEQDLVTLVVLTRCHALAASLAPSRVAAQQAREHQECRERHHHGHDGTGSLIMY